MVRVAATGAPVHIYVQISEETILVAVFAKYFVQVGCCIAMLDLLINQEHETIYV